MAHTKMYEPAVKEPIRIVSENILVQFDHDVTAPVELYIVAGIEGVLAKMTEITVDGVNATRTTLTGTGTASLNISGLTPNTFIAATTEGEYDDAEITIRVLSSNPYGSEQR